MRRSPRLLQLAAAAVAAGLGLAWGIAGCSSDAPPGARPSAPATTSVLAWGSAPHPSAAPASPKASSSAVPPAVQAMIDALASGEPAAPPPESGDWIAIMGVQGNVYSQPNGAKEGRIGYIRRGMKVLGKAQLVKGKNCDEGWYPLIPTGYVCARSATTDLDNPQVKLGVHEPRLDELLPYRYARNVSHGTPLYRVVPTRAQMIEFEPYLRKASDKEVGAPEEAAPEEPTPKATSKQRAKKGKKKRARDGGVDPGERDPARRTEAAGDEAAEKPGGDVEAKGDPTPPRVVTTTTGDAGVADADAEIPPRVAALDAGTEAPDAGDDDEKLPWWQRKYDPGKTPEIKLSDLLEDSNRVLAKRMVRGFYVAVDRTFQLNGRLWHHTTGGLVAPADRMAIIAPPKFAGEEIDEANKDHPVAFVRAERATTYELDAKGALRPKRQLVRYDRAWLTGATREIGGRSFRETLTSEWLREADITWTDPGKPPADLKAGERWIDVNLTRQTLVAFEGDRPVYATMVSTGRKGKDKAHDHTTPVGAWRIREKHVAITMDGDGAVAGDLPYSIEDVPFVMYYEGSYAVHGAFWHDNFGRQQSHGCVNLAPADAKRLFFWADPQIPKGWHGAFSRDDRPGSLVVVHD